MNYLQKIDAYYSTLSKKERIFADYIRENGSDVIYETLSEVSKKLGIGEATIMRFCHKLKFNGFQDMKLEVAKVTIVDKKAPAGEGLIDAKATSVISSIQATQNSAELATIKKIASMIYESEDLYFFGLTNSGMVAESAQHRFMRMGKVGNAVIDHHNQLIVASIVNSESLILVYTLDGATLNIYEPVKIAKRNKAKIVAITNNIVSPVGKLADIKVQTFGIETPLEGGSIEAQFSQLFVTDLIATQYYQNHEKAIRRKKEKQAKAIIKQSMQ